MSIENQPFYMSHETDEGVPCVEPALEEAREEPDTDKEKRPPLPPEKIQEIIDSISNEEAEERRRKEEVNGIIERIREEKQ